MNGVTSEIFDAYLETLRLLTIELGPQHSFHASLRGLLRILGARHAFLRPHLVIYDPETCTLRLCVTESDALSRHVVYEPGMGITGQVFTKGRPVIVERISESSVFQNRFFQRSPEEMRELSFVSVPIMGVGQEPTDGQEVLGVLSVDLPRAERPVLEGVRHFMEVVAGLIGNQVSYMQQEMARQSLPEPEVASAQGQPAGVVAVSKSLRQVLTQAAQAGNSRSAVLLKGEAGTGKELLAELIHTGSTRCHMPLLRLNCAVLDPETLDAELFGVQKDALPQVAQTSKGILERANMGSVYLNSVELLPPAVQEKLLHAVCSQEVVRVGGTRGVAVDVRLICSTQENNPVAHGLSRELYQHLSSLTITVPPLRERREDIVPLAEFFMQKAAQEQDKVIRRISHPAIELLMHYAWTGNARELKGCMERAVGACQEDTIRASHLPPSLQLKGDEDADVLSFTDAVERFEQELLVDALQRARGNMLEASRLLNTSYRIINYKVKKLHIDPKRFTVR